MLAAVLLPRRVALASTMAVLFSLGVAGLELSLLDLVSPMGRTSSELVAAFAIKNVIQCAWVLAIVATLRTGGYRLVSASRVSAGAQA